ncbi:trehalase [Leptobacterium flavescens]|uniref:Trehalase n=1 Tax=Leptobacterium flavescens TaxID=472055 RepID=A0A6P0UH79_9FLAO|nr:trehalase family glycosidase [Leptobacterium flavescens]NER12671.1 trehalase [Leptobacterium flavescens]
MLFRLNIEETLQKLLRQEDTDGDKKITKEDRGPKRFKLQTEDGAFYTVKGTYYLSNLLQELAIARNKGKEYATIPLRRIEEKPANRISRMIRRYFWDDLTRTIDEAGIMKIVGDEKAEGKEQRIYVPLKDEHAIEYYNKLKRKYPEINISVLPDKITPEYVLSINNKPGILALKLEGKKGVPFVVPGGRFNEMYGWDSYFEAVGLLLDDREDLAKAMIDNFCYQIKYYGKILNANRSYYLTRTQPPFLSSFIREVCEAGKNTDLKWLTEVLTIAIREYESVWMVSGKRLTENGLNRYLAEGIGIPPETEEGHFDEVLEEYARKYELNREEFQQKYMNREIVDEELDMYFVHDRSLRESGHDTSWRLDNVCADLNTVDLNALLYKYETDFEYLINTYFDGTFQTTEGKSYSAAHWKEMAAARKRLINVYLWDKTKECFYDYNFKLNRQTFFESATNFYPLWAGICNQDQAEKLKEHLMNSYKARGGVLATTKASVSHVPDHLPKRQWDYPNGWAPHQMVIWKGLLNYGYEKEAEELVYRWLWMITVNAVDYNGTIPEKYDVVACTHKVYAEYGNVGTEFDYITTSGFGWMNASYQYGLSILSPELREKLNELADPDILFK